jgi:hypothetical protein
MTTTYWVYHQKIPQCDRANIVFVGVVKVRPLECAFEAARKVYPWVKHPLVQNVDGYKNTFDDDEYPW